MSNLILLIAAFVGGCFAGGFINHWMISSGITKALQNLEASVGKIKPAPAPAKPVVPAK